MPRFNIDVMQEQVGKLYRMILDHKAAPRGMPAREAPAPAGAVSPSLRSDGGDFAPPTRPHGA
jgi:hypothetical protein